MPEGPEIRRAADLVASALKGHTAVTVEFGLERLAHHGERLSGRRIDAVEARGKALLLHFSGGESVYTHNQLYGRWRVGAAGARPASSRSLRLAIDTRTTSALLYSASDIEVSTPAALAEHPYIARLGVELLAPETELEEVFTQVSAPRHAGRSLGALLLDQGFLAGLGNYLRSEILFVARLTPALRPRDLSDAERAALANAALELTRQSYRTGGITNDLTRAAALKRRRLSFGRYRHHVFDREGEPCWVCATPVRRIVAAGRNLFLCPRCQSPRD